MKPRIEPHRQRNPELPLAVNETPNGLDGRPALLPVRYPDPDLFICDVLDAIPKDDMASMEHPIFSLATKPDRRVFRYEHNGNRIEIVPSVKGLATIHDKDILIYCISQLIAKMNQGGQPGRTLHLTARDLLMWTNRQTDGDGYERLRSAFERLSGTRITTNIKADGEEITEGFGLINEWRIVRKTKSGQMSEIKVTLSDWLLRMVEGRSVLTLHRDYFRLRKPLERRIYELARKHCGAQDKWSVSAETLRKKTGASSHIRVFRAMLRELVLHNHLPDYVVEMTGDTVTFRNRDALEAPDEPPPERPFIDPEGFHDAKGAAPGYDVYSLYEDWVSWWNDSGRPELKSPRAAFIGFCRTRHKQHPLR
ncbi:plasmid replication initiator protein RepA [Polymorphobacter multimanifer]|uniref:replication initiator protein A n=1 Tax=Polymorphobacter multimanifer TaxID=1070431 RepID=UPI00166B223A|nr:replication initiator protein A [Polymorphobacter multimanifer]GGI94090.1 plasmid replication initiator protein RepA [Polymorphobacter multimanifer]